MLEARWPFEAVNVIERSGPACVVLGALHQRRIWPQDLAGMDAEDFESSDGLFGGPPCIAFSMLGKGEGLYSVKGEPFLQCLAMIQVLANREERPLKWVVLENVKAFMYERSSGSAAEEVRKWWAEYMKAWTPLEPYLVNANECHSAQDRARVFLISFALDFAEAVGGLPEKPMVCQTPRLEPFLLPLSVVDEHSKRKPTPKMKKNIEGFARHFKKQMHLTCEQVKGLTETTYAIFDASRKAPVPGVKPSHSSRLFIERCPTLTYQNSYLYVAKLGPDGSKVSSRGRFLDVRERANLCGVEWTSVDGLCSNLEHSRQFGNMIPVDLVGTILERVISKWLVWEQRLVSLSLHNVGSHLASSQSSKCRL